MFRLLNVSIQGWYSTTSPGNLFHLLVTLTVRKMFSDVPSCPVVEHDWKREITLCTIPSNIPIYIWWDCFLYLPFCWGWRVPSLSGLSLHYRCSSPLIFLVVLHWTSWSFFDEVQWKNFWMEVEARSGPFISLSSVALNNFAKTCQWLMHIPLLSW